MSGGIIRPNKRDMFIPKIISINMKIYVYINFVLVYPG